MNDTQILRHALELGDDVRTWVDWTDDNRTRCRVATKFGWVHATVMINPLDEFIHIELIEVRAFDLDCWNYPTPATYRRQLPSFLTWFGRRYKDPVVRQRWPKFLAAALELYRDWDMTDYADEDFLAFDAGYELTVSY